MTERLEDLLTTDALAQAEADIGTTESAEVHRALADEYREYALRIERVLIGMNDE